jgi:hypothetical protein
MIAKKENQEKTLRFTTQCQDCIFRVDELYSHDSTTGQTNYGQSSCKLGRLYKFEKQGLATFNKDKQSYTIQTVCNAYRDQEWANQYSEPEKTVLQQIQIQCDFVIICHYPDNLKTALVNSAKECLRQYIQPKHLIFIIQYTKNQDMKAAYDALAEILSDKIDFCVIRIFETASDLEQYQDDFSVYVDRAFDRIQSTYYAVFMYGKPIPSDYLVKINDLINVDMRRIIMVDNHDYHGLLMQKLIHQRFRGNIGLPLRQKIHQAAKLQENENMITTYGKLYES